MDTLSGQSDAERQRHVETHLPREVAFPGRGAAPAPLVAAMQRYLVPGCSIAVITNMQLAWTQGYGVAMTGRPTPVAPDTIFQACSISKPVAAVAATRLVQEGVLDLDADINTALRSWRVPANDGWQPRVTLRHLLSHAAGLTYCWYPGYRRGMPTPTLLQTLRGEPPATTPPVRVTAIPGTQSRYSGSHFSALQQLLEDVTGEPFPKLMRALVFAPLDMRHTSYDQAFPDTHSGATAAGHDLGGWPIDGQWRVLPEMAGAGLWTTAGDLARLAIAIQQAFTGRPSAVLNQASAQRMLGLQIADRGLGWQVQPSATDVRFEHGGDNIGYKCRLVAYARQGVGAVVMTNGDEGAPLITEIMHAVARDYGWPTDDDGETAAEPAGAAGGAADRSPVDARYAGAYVLADGLRCTVAVEQGHVLLIPATQPPIPLRPISGPTYALDRVNATLTFVMRADGQASGFTLRQHGEEAGATKIS